MASRLAKHVIVIVEDTVAIAELSKDTLNGEPAYQAVVVVDGAHAFDVIPSVRARRILFDYHLPGRTGRHIDDLLPQDPATQAMPVLFLTASSGDPGFTARGCTHVLAKPFARAPRLQAVAQRLPPAAAPAGGTARGDS